MKIEEIKERAKRAAQTPFRIRMTDGQILDIKHPEFMGFPREQGVFVYFPETGGIQIVSSDEVVSLDLLPQAAKS